MLEQDTDHSVRLLPSCLCSGRRYVALQIVFKVRLSSHQAGYFFTKKAFVPTIEYDRAY